MVAEVAARRAKLDQRVIVDAVLELARTESGSRITFKRLGDALGVDATAMYRHFRNKDELTRAAMDRLFSMAVAPARAATGTWRERLETYLMRTAELSLEYPSIGTEGALVDPAGPGDAACVEFILEMLSDAGLTGRALIRAYAAVSGFSLSQSAALAREAMMSESAVRDGSIPWITTFGTVDLSAYPHIHAHRDELLAIDGISVYRAGIDAILDSIERSAAGVRTRRSPDELSTVEPGTVEPGTDRPSAVELSTVEPGTVELSPDEPSTVEPGTVELSTDE